MPADGSNIKWLREEYDRMTRKMEAVRELIGEALEWVPDGLAISDGGFQLKVLPPLSNQMLKEPQVVTGGAKSMRDWKDHDNEAATFSKAAVEPVIADILQNNPDATVEVFVIKHAQRCGRIATVKGDA